MRFEVSYSSGTRHEVDLAGSVVVLGRDPGCDLVLNDTKCSRRHAIVEASPEGAVIRDCGSANGVLLNGRRVESAPLQPGDTLRLGDVRLIVLPEIGETVIVATDDPGLQPPLVAFPPELPRPASHRAPTGPQGAPRKSAPASPADGSPPLSAPRARAAAPPLRTRPLTVSVLAVLWAMGGPASAIVVAVFAWRLGGLAASAAATAVAALLCAIGLAMSLGLWTLAPWARHLQVASSVLGLLICPFTPAAATALLYMNRADVRRTFRPGATTAGAGTAETTFALSIAAMVAFGLVASLVIGILLRPSR